MKNIVRNTFIVIIFAGANFLHAQVYDTYLNYKIVSGIGITYEQQNWSRDRLTLSYSYYYHPKVDGDIRYTFKFSSNTYLISNITYTQREAFSFYFGNSLYLGKNAKRYGGYLSGFNISYKLGYKLYKSALIDSQRLLPDLKWISNIQDNNMRVMPSLAFALNYKSKAPKKIFWQFSIGEEFNKLPQYKNINNISTDQLKTYQEIQDQIQKDFGLALPLYFVFSVGYRID